MVATLFQQDLSQHASQQARVPLANRPLPPSERDLAVYEAVVVECQSTRTAAERFELSQTRIVQIRDRVIEWIAENVPPTPRLTPRQRLHVAEDIARRRAEFFLSEAVAAWHASKEPQTSVRTHSTGQTITTRRSYCGDVRYLTAASRLSEHALKLIGIVQRFERGIEPRDLASSVREHAEAPADHPVGDCSLEAAPHDEPPPAADEIGHVSEAPAATYDDRTDRRRAFLAGESDVSSPVHERLDEPAAADEATVGRTFSPSALPAPVSPAPLSAASLTDGLEVRPTGQRSLSRKERLARRRLLEKLRRKAK